LGSHLAAFLLEFLFASARQISKHFHASLTTNKEILSRQLGPSKVSRSWVPHRLSEDQKAARVRDSRALLAILDRSQDNSLECIPSRDESWFLYEYQPNSIFAASRETVPLRYEHGIQAKTILITIFFAPTLLLVLAALAYSETFTRDHFITEVLPMLREENVQFRRKHSGDNFCVHMDNLQCPNRKKITAEIEHRRLAGAPPPPYSPDHSPCDFWIFGLIKHSLKDREIRAVQTLINALSKI
jgi:histone-lysine N-methyltransferase SETMAR